MTPPLSVSVQHEFRRRLQQELAERCARNPRYSLRAFAVWLRVDHSTLAQLIRGARPITTPTVVRLGVRLGLDQSEIDDYLSGSIPPRPSGHPALAEAILGLISRPGPRPDSRWIARTLGVTEDDVNRVLPELLRTKRLAMTNRHRWLVQPPK